MGRLRYLIVFAIFLCLALLLIFSISSKPPVKIGLMVSLTGKSPEVGREIRDGAFLAIEEINKKGGIKGRYLSLIIKDNKGDFEVAKRNFFELKREDVIAIIGPVTSTTAKKVSPLANENRILLISPTVSSSDFTGKDDYLITLHPNAKKLSFVLGKYIKEKIKPNKISILYDERNPVYVRDSIKNFIINFEKTIINQIPIKEEMEDFDSIVNNALEIKPQLILIVSDTFNASILIQKIRKIAPNITIAISHWARFHGFLEHTGELSEGVLSVGFYDTLNPTKDYLNFQNRFIETFGYTPDYPAINAYHAVFMIYDAMLEGASKDNIKEYIIKKGKFKGLIGELAIDNYGDPLIEPFVVKVNKGVFEKVKE